MTTTPPDMNEKILAAMEGNNNVRITTLWIAGVDGHPPRCIFVMDEHEIAKIGTEHTASLFRQAADELNVPVEDRRVIELQLDATLVEEAFANDVIDADVVEDDS